MRPAFFFGAVAYTTLTWHTLDARDVKDRTRLGHRAAGAHR